MSPARFNVGDIVEAQFVFSLVAVERNQQRLQMVLQGLTLLENSFSRVRIESFSKSDALIWSCLLQQALVTRISKTLRPSVDLTRRQIKRKIGYAEEEYAITRRKLQDLEINDDEKNGSDTSDEDSNNKEVKDESQNDASRVKSL